MKYIVLPFVLVLGIVELLIRGLLVALTFICTVGLIMFLWMDHERDVLQWLQSNVCFKIAERLVA